MKKVCFSILLLLLSCVVNAQEMYWTTMTTALPYNWGSSNTSDPVAKLSVVDKWGNMYVTANSSFLAKYNSAGDQIWSVSIGFDNYSIDADTLGYIYITGGPGSIRKLDSSGNVIWARNIGLKGIDIAVDKDLNVFMAGSTGITPDLDPGPGVFPVDTAGALLVKLDSGGNFLWAYADAIFDFSAERYYNAVDLDVDGNAYVGGVYGGLAYRYGYVKKISSDGTVVWNWEYQSSGSLGDEILDVKVSDSNYLYVIGLKDFYPGQGGEYFIAKRDTSGVAIWQRIIPGSIYSYSAALDIDNNGSVYITGCANIAGGSADFDPGPGTAPLHSEGLPGSFILKLDAGGNYEWASTIFIPFPTSQMNATYGYNIDVDDNCNIYVTSLIDCDENVDVDPGAGTYEISGTGIFIQKIGCSAAGVGDVIVKGKGVSVYPNPTTGSINIASPDKIHSVRVMDMLGRVVLDKEMASSAGVIALDVPDGVYHVSVQTDKGAYTEKVVVSK